MHVVKPPTKCVDYDSERLEPVRKSSRQLLCFTLDLERTRKEACSSDMWRRRRGGWGLLVCMGMQPPNDLGGASVKSVINPVRLTLSSHKLHKTDACIFTRVGTFSFFFSRRMNQERSASERANLRPDKNVDSRRLLR